MQNLDGGSGSLSGYMSRKTPGNRPVMPYFNNSQTNVGVSAMNLSRAHSRGSKNRARGIPDHQSGIRSALVTPLSANTSSKRN